MFFSAGSGSMIFFDLVLFILILLSKPVVYKGNISTVTYINASAIPYT